MRWSDAVFWWWNVLTAMAQVFLLMRGRKKSKAQRCRLRAAQDHGGNTNPGTETRARATPSLRAPLGIPKQTLNQRCGAWEQLPCTAQSSPRFPAKNCLEMCARKKPRRRATHVSLQRAKQRLVPYSYFDMKKIFFSQTLWAQKTQ